MKILLILLAWLSTVASFTSIGRPTNSLISRKSSAINRKVPANAVLKMSNLDGNVAAEKDGFDPAAWLNPNTRGGVLVWSAILTVIPVGLYNVLVSSGMDSSKAGANVGFAFVCLSMVGWASTYIFRVANKDMTYARQLREYENAVLQKRLEELADDEIQALLEEIESEDDKKTAPSQ
jgi:hypothetical protein